MIKTCAKCERRGRSAYAFKRATPEQRAVWRADGLVTLMARGLCVGCYKHESVAGTLDEWERRNRAADEILEEWLHLADPLLPIRQECHRLAGQFRMDWRALEQAVHRAGIRSRFTDFANSVKVAA